VLLFFVLTPVHGQLLSDATGLINRMDIQTSGYDFEVVLTANFDLLDYAFDINNKQLTLYLDSGLENNLGEIIIPTTLLSGDFRFYLNDQEFFPKVQSDEKINFITMNFTGLGNNVVTIIGTEYLSGLDDIAPIENNSSKSLDNDFLPPDGQSNQTLSDDYLIWLIVGGIVIVITMFVVIKFLKNKN
tara:strand:+ start:132 stop:692 length:561 start_codon:yes stop_codon:yes gene_type:complete